MRKPGMSDNLQCAFVDGDRGTGERDGRALTVADGDAGVGDGNKRATRGLEKNAAGWAGNIADHQHILLRGLDHYLLHRGGRSESEGRKLFRRAPEATNPYGII